MHDDFDFPSREDLRNRRVAYANKVMEDLKHQPNPDDELDAAWLKRHREGMERANEYCRQRDPRSMAERLGYEVGDDLGRDD